MPLLQKRLAWPAHIVHSLLIPLLTLVVLFAAPLAGQQRTDIGAEARLQSGHWIVTFVSRGGIADRAGLLVGDEVVALDGEAPRLVRSTDRSLDLSVASQWTVLRQGSYLTLYPDIGHAPWDNGLEPLLLLIIALSFWAVGTFVQWNKPQDGLARRFHRLSLAIALALGLAPAGESILWAKVLEVMAFALLPALFIEFFLCFERGTSPSGRGLLVVRALYLAGLVVGGLYLAAGLFGSPWYDAIRSVLLGLMALGFVGGLAHLGRAYRYPRSLHVRKQSQIVALGTAAAVLPLTVLSLIPEALGQPPIIRSQYAALGAALLPLSFGYAILRRRLMEIEVVIERTLVYGIMTLLLSGCYALFLYGLGAAGRGSTAEINPLLSLLFFAAVTLTFIPVRDRVRMLIDALVYRDRYDYAQTLRTLGAQLASGQPIDEVLASVAEHLARAMNLRGVAFLLRQPEGELAVRGASAGYYESGADRLMPSRALSDPDGGGERILPDGCIPLIANGEEHGLLHLGTKRAASELTDEDLSLAQTVASQASVAIANALLVERLQAQVAELELLRDQLLHVQEEERKRLAQDLHDGPLHTVLDLVRQAEAATESLVYAEAGVQALSERLHGLAERGRDAAYEVRSVCSELYPSELTHLGLPAALESLARRTSRDENIRVHFSMRDFPIERRLPPAVEETLYRVAREALANVCRHAQATVAQIVLAAQGDWVWLSVRDDGCGFVVPASLGALVRKGHLGLLSIRDRVQRLGGELTVTSVLGNGTEVSMRVPVPDERGELAMTAAIAGPQP